MDLELMVWREEQILELLGITRKSLETLIDKKGFPCRRITNKTGVYLADEVLDWIRQQ